MNISSKVEVGAQFRLITHKGDPSNPTKETPFFKNLVLNSGLARLSVGSAIGRVCVGSGNSIPVVTQTSLDNFIASTTLTQGADTFGGQGSTNPIYYWARRTYRFREGVAAGNLSEIGIGWGDVDLFNRALIKDTNGNPTTITVLSDEYLDVVVELRVYPTNFYGSFDLKNKLGDIVSTHSVSGSPFFGSGNSFALGKITPDPRFLVYSGIKQDPLTVEPLGYAGDTTSSISSYPTPTSVKQVSKFTLNQANSSHKSFVARYVNFLSGSSSFKWEITPPISKNNTLEITYEFTLTWGRYEPT